MRIISSSDMKRRKSYKVGLWMDLMAQSNQTGLQIWSIQKGSAKEPELKWYTVVLGLDEDEALQLGQAEYASKNIEEKVQAA